MNSTPDFLHSFSSKNETEQKKAALKMLSGMDSKQSEQIKNILKDEEKIREILSSPQAQELIKKLKGNNNGQHK